MCPADIELAVSGGWLGQVVIAISKTFGLWDPLVLFVLGVGFYQIVRTSMMEISMILGFYFDGVIPLQYWQKEGSYAIHKDHLDDYWPMFLVGTLIEVGAYILLDPGSFTFLVCLKSLGLAWVWMGRKKDGVFLSTAIRRGKLAKPSQIPLGGVDWIVEPNKKAPSSTQELKLPPFPKDPRHPDAETKLRAKYSDPWTRWGMIHDLKDSNSKNAAHKLEQWLKDDTKESRIKKYGAIAREEVRRRQKASLGGTPSSQSQQQRAPSAPAPSQQRNQSGSPPFPQDPRFPGAVDKLKKRYKDDWLVWGLMDQLVQENDAKFATKRLKGWLEEDKGSKWEEKWSERGKTAAAKYEPSIDRSANTPGTDKPAASRSKTSSGKVGMDLAKADKMLQALYPDKIVREGMLETYRATRDAERAEQNLKRWATEKDQVKRRTEEYRKKGQLGRQWRKELKNWKVPVFVDESSESWNRDLRNNFPNPWARYAILNRLNEMDSASRKAKANGYIHMPQDRGLKQRRLHYADYGLTIQDLFDDDGYTPVGEVYTSNHKRGQKIQEEGEFPEASKMGGKGLKADVLKILEKRIEKTRMSRSERAKILEVFRRPRCLSQERAALARLKDHKIDFKLDETESATSVKRFESTLDPEIAEWVRNQLEGEDLDTRLTPFQKRELVEGLKSNKHTEEDMGEIGKILDIVGLNPTSAPSTSQLAFKPAQLLSLRMKLLKLYEEISLVDVMMGHVIRSSSKQDADNRANFCINVETKDMCRTQFLPLAYKLEGMKDELSKYFKENIVEVMKVDILSKEPSEWDQVYKGLLAIGQGEKEKYEETVKAYKKRAANDAYFSQWKKNDLKVKGVLQKLLATVKLDRHHFD